MNCFEGSYKGIDFVQTACASFRCYGNELRGVRVFEINEVDPSDYLTYSLTYSDLCGRGIGSKLRYIWDCRRVRQRESRSYCWCGGRRSGAHRLGDKSSREVQKITY